MMSNALRQRINPTSSDTALWAAASERRVGDLPTIPPRNPLPATATQPRGSARSTPKPVRGDRFPVRALAPAE